ncbi:MAG: hypothetical protein NTU53_21140 [Planctomycetota bacterium]|nr:hypothetical protein [Planctomycetota bacterium]
MHCTVLAVGLVAALVLLLPIGSQCSAQAASQGSAPQLPVETRSAMVLDGDWDCATDPQELGEKEKWFEPDLALPVKTYPGYAPKVNGKIIVPGVWDNQGYGSETPKARHNFLGKAWYKRQVTIPREWGGSRLFLKIGGVHRYAKAWVNGRYLGEHIGYLAPFEYDLTDCAMPGQIAVIAIQVDSRQRWDVDGMFGAGDLADYMDIEWGGIWGHVTLEARAESWLDDLFIQTKTSPPVCRATATLRGDGRHVRGVRLDVLDSNRRPVARQWLALNAPPGEGASLELKVDVPEAKLWTPDAPNLHVARLSLLTKDGRVVDAVETGFGIREIKVDGHRILLNGHPIFLRGYGDDHIYPQYMAMPVDKAMYLQRLKLVKSYGFNHVRHHSTIMPPEYYDACDETGILSTAEFPIAYQQFYDRATQSPAAMETYRRQWAAAIVRHRNHPSILCWVMGNELWGGVPLGREFGAIARRLDPTRPYADSDGLFKSFVDRDTLDLHFLMFDVARIPLDVPDKFVIQPPRKPVISHETGNYNTFPRLAQFDEFKGSIKPFWTVEGRQRLGRMGLLAEANTWAENSERLYLLCHKLNIEALRKSPYISGHHWWLFQDYWTTSNGIVDSQYRPKSIRPEEVRPFVNDVVLLVDGLDVTYRGKGSLKLSLIVSNYSNEPIANARVVWRVKAGDQPIGDKEMVAARVGQGDVAAVGRIEVTLPDVVKPTCLRVEVELRAPLGRYQNAWTTWVYPSATETGKLDVPVYAAAEVAALVRSFGSGPMPEDKTLDSRAVYVASDLEPRLIDAAERGACLVLLGSSGLLPSNPATFKASWWKGDGDRDNNCGTVVYDHAVTRDMALGGWCDAGWYHLLQGASHYNLEGLQSRPDVIVRAIPHLHIVRDNAFLIEARVGKGSLIVSGLNHAAAKGRPEGEWIMSRILRHAAGLPKPRAELPADVLRSRMPTQPPSGPYVHGFRAMVSKESEEGEWFSYREDRAKAYICRQTRPGNSVEWETDVVPLETKGASVTFRFAGGLGYSSQPKTEGFVLVVNGTDVLRFDLAELLKWSSADSKATLMLVPRRALPEDQVGFYYLTVSRELVKPGQAARLGVRSLGSGSRRWFGLNPYAAIE